jgi:hypothetical protein
MMAPDLGIQRHQCKTAGDGGDIGDNRMDAESTASPALETVWGQRGQAKWPRLALHNWHGNVPPRVPIGIEKGGTAEPRMNTSCPHCPQCPHKKEVRA